MRRAARSGAYGCWMPNGFDAELMPNGLFAGAARCAVRTRFLRTTLGTAFAAGFAGLLRESWAWLRASGRPSAAGATALIRGGIAGASEAAARGSETAQRRLGSGSGSGLRLERRGFGLGAAFLRLGAIGGSIEAWPACRWRRAPAPSARAARPGRSEMTAGVSGSIRPRPCFRPVLRRWRRPARSPAAKSCGGMIASGGDGRSMSVGATRTSVGATVLTAKRRSYITGTATARGASRDRRPA